MYYLKPHEVMVVLTHHLGLGAEQHSDIRWGQQC
jgi:hypothetical protein